MKKRLPYIITFVLFTAIEVFIALYVHDSFIRPYLGDVLVIIVLYGLVRSFIPDGIRLLPLYLFFIGVVAETMQYINILSILGLENNTFMRVLLGTSFSFGDIVCYAAGCCIVGIYEKVLKKRS